MSNLLHAAWDRKIVREFCDLSCVPSIWSSLETDADGNCIGIFDNGFKVNQKYIDGKKKADAMFNDIMSSPEKIRGAVGCYSEFLQEQRIDYLESELASLKEARAEKQGRKLEQQPTAASCNGESKVGS